jgi:hypothetical protein
MHIAYLIVRIQTNDPIVPAIRLREHVLSGSPLAISIPDPNYIWATLTSTLPNNPSTQITFNVAIEKRNENSICGYEVHWEHGIANMRLLALATEDMWTIARLGAEFEFRTELTTASAGASAHLKWPAMNRSIKWQVVKVEVEDK